MANLILIGVFFSGLGGLGLTTVLGLLTLGLLQPKTRPKPQGLLPLKKILKNIFNEEKLNDEKITNQKRIEVYEQKKSLSKYEKNKLAKKIERKVWPLLRLNKIIKFENNKYLLLHKIKNSDLKIIKMKSPNL